MLINRNNIPNNKEIELNGEIDFSNYPFDKNYISKILSCKVSIKAKQYEDLLRLKVHVISDVVGVCAYTLEDVPLHLDFNDELDFFEEDDGENLFEPKPCFAIDEYILALIFAYLPPKIIKSGAKLPSDGDGYRVLSEEDLAKERKENNNPFSVFDDIEL